MHPFFYIFGNQVSGYAVMGLIGFLASVLFLLIQCCTQKFSFDDVIYIFVLGMIGAMLGAKLLYLLIEVQDIFGNLRNALHNPLLYLRAYVSGGMVFYGGLCGGVIAAKKAADYFNIDLASHYDIFIPTIPLFAGFGRFGCLMEGCCYGKETNSIFHIVFHNSLFAPNNVPLIPTQLYEAIFDFALFAVLIVLGKDQKKIPHLLDIYLIFYASFRFVIEFFRGDLIRGVRILSTSQWISVAVLVVLLVQFGTRKQDVQHDAVLR